MSTIERIEELRKEIAALQMQALEEQLAAKKTAIDEIKALMAEKGVTLDDLAGRKPRGKVAPGKSDGRKSVVPKFRNPDTGETWSGRGQQPRWLRAFVDAGKTVDEFRI